jgi:hypothetical protein
LTPITRITPGRYDGDRHVGATADRRAPTWCRQGAADGPGAQFCISQRAEHIWEGVSSATTRSRPIINTRDEPLSNAEKYRRLHVIVGDSNMSEHTTS